jgi:hypothetical protein
MDEELAKLLERKEKADKLPEKQLKKWKTEYEELVKKIIELEKKQLASFTPKKANELMDYMTQYGPGNLTRKQIEFLNENPELDQKYGMQLCKIDRVYNEKRSITELEMEIRKYVEIWKEIIEKSKG